MPYLSQLLYSPCCVLWIQIHYFWIRILKFSTNFDPDPSHFARLYLYCITNLERKNCKKIDYTI